ncbi:MAG: hypothetical protein AB7O43_03870 [Hyphomicrobiaceae bacterium]
MSLSYYDGKERPEGLWPTVLMIFNAGLACVVVFLWRGIEFFVAEPLQWATWVSISSSPDLLEYPYLLAWGLPVFGIVGCWFAAKAKQRGLALIVGLYPALFLGLTIGWYYLAPRGWH